MNVKDKVIAIIPARGGSKGLPRKNIKNLCGKPLIAYSILIAKAARMIDTVIVSTEDNEIAEISQQYGAVIPFLRPADLAQDKSSLGQAVHYTINQLKKEGYEFTKVVVLYPTSPFRTVEMLDSLADLLHQGYQNVISVKPIDLDNHIFFARHSNGILESIFDKGHQSKKTPRIVFRQYGLFLGYNYKGDERRYNYVIESPYSLIDIDLARDFYLAEEVIRQDLFDFGLQGMSC